VLFRLAHYNIRRNPTRSILSSLVIALGVFVAILGQGLVMGIDENVMRAHTQSETGDFVLIAEENSPIPLPDLSAHQNWTDRLILPAEIIENGIQIPIQIIGYNPQKQSSVFQAQTWCQNGKWPYEKNHIGIGSGLTSLLDSTKTITIALETKNNIQVAGVFDTSCIIHTHNLALDSISVWLPISTLETLSQYRQERTHILSRNPLPSSTGWAQYTATQRAEPMLAVNRIRKKVLQSIYGIIILIASLGITSTILITIDQRRSELAILRALGLSKIQLLTIILYEQLLIVLLSSLLAATISGYLNYYWSIRGIDLSQQLQGLGSTSVSLVLYTEFSWSWMLICILSTIMIALLPTAVFTYFHQNLEPATLLREAQ